MHGDVKASNKSTLKRLIIIYKAGKDSFVFEYELHVTRYTILAVIQANVSKKRQKDKTDIGDITCPLVDMNFIFDLNTRR